MEQMCTPAFFIQNEVISKDDPVELKPYEVCMAMSRAINRSEIEGAQNVREIWRLYLKTKDAKAKLLASGISIRNTKVNVFEQNPSATGLTTNANVAEKIIIKDLPLSVSNAEVEEFLQGKEGLNVTSNVKYSYMRDPDGKLTSFKNGDRFVYAMTPVPVLMRNDKIGDRKVRIFHNAQFNKCEACGKPGHAPGNKLCEEFQEDVNYMFFSSFNHILSNDFLFEITWKNKTFKSVTHAYMHEFVMAKENYHLANEIRKAEHAGIVRKLVCESYDDSIRNQWIEDNQNIMFDLIQAKVQQNEAFAQCLFANKCFAYSNYDLFWGTGLNYRQSSHTNPLSWPGKNKLGALFDKIGEMLRNKDKDVEKNTETNNPGDVSVPEVNILNTGDIRKFLAGIRTTQCPKTTSRKKRKPNKRKPTSSPQQKDASGTVHERNEGSTEYESYDEGS